MKIAKKKRPRDVNQRAYSILQDVIALSEGKRRKATPKGRKRSK